MDGQASCRLRLKEVVAQRGEGFGQWKDLIDRRDVSKMKVLKAAELRDRWEGPEKQRVGNVSTFSTKEIVQPINT